MNYLTTTLSPIFRKTRKKLKPLEEPYFVLPTDSGVFVLTHELLTDSSSKERLHFLAEKSPYNSDSRFFIKKCLCPLEVHKELLAKQQAPKRHLNHKNAHLPLEITSVSSHEKSNKTPAIYNISKYLCGFDFSELFVIEPKDDLFLKLVCSTIAIASEGIIHAHENGFLHHDIKPENLIFAYDSYLSIKVIDWDYSLPIGIPTNAGTAGYVDPSRLDSKPTVLSDIYSIAVSLHSILFGQNYYSLIAKSNNALLYQNRALEYLPNIPKKLTYLIYSSTNLNQNKRPSSLSIFRDELLSIVDCREFLAKIR